MTTRSTDDAATGALLDAWTSRVLASLEIDPAAVDRDTVLGVAGTVAHRVVRPAAPVSTYLAGIVVGRAIERGDDPAAALTATAEVVRAAAAAWAAGPSA